MEHGTLCKWFIFSEIGLRPVPDSIINHFFLKFVT